MTSCSTVNYVKQKKYHKKPFLMNELLLSLLLLFCYLFKQGNLNLLYFYGILIILYSLFKCQSVVQKSLLWMLPLMLSCAFSFLFSNFNYSAGKSLITCLKIFLCLNIMFFFSKNMELFDFKKAARYVFWILAVCFAVALLFRNSFLWVQNEEVNMYSEHRLQLLFLEPSQLGFVLGILLLFVAFNLISNKRSAFAFVFFCLIAVMLYFSMPLGGILSFFIAFFFMILVLSISKAKNNGKIKKIASFLFVCLIGIIIVVLSTSNPISNRLFDIKSGSDGSFNGRISLSLNTLPILLEKTMWFGVGLGNINTDSVLAVTRHIYSNSFLAFFAETGIVGLVYLIALLSYLLKGIKKEKVLRLSLFIYLFVFQVQGGYFTDPSIWAFYGVIISPVFVFQKSHFKKCVPDNFKQIFKYQ